MFNVKFSYSPSQATARSGLVDKKVIDGHVLLNNVIFTSAAPIEVPQTTAAFEDNLKVTVTFFKEKNGISKYNEMGEGK